MVLTVALHWNSRCSRSLRCRGDPLTDVVVAIDELTAALAIQFGVDPATAAAASLADLPPQAILIALLLEARAAF